MREPARTSSKPVRVFGLSWLGGQAKNADTETPAATAEIARMRMPITDMAAWEEWEEANQDPYGKACVDVAREVMRLLDERLEPIAEPNRLISDADDSIKAGGITGFMAGCVAQMVSKCHSRGEEFRRAWNHETQLGTEGDRANESGGVLNPALLSIEVPDA